MMSVPAYYIKVDTKKRKRSIVSVVTKTRRLCVTCGMLAEDLVLDVGWDGEKAFSLLSQAGH